MRQSEAFATVWRARALRKPRLNHNRRRCGAVVKRPSGRVRGWHLLNAPSQSRVLMGLNKVRVGSDGGKVFPAFAKFRTGLAPDELGACAHLQLGARARQSSWRVCGVHGPRRGGKQGPAPIKAGARREEEASGARLPPTRRSRRVCSATNGQGGSTPIRRANAAAAAARSPYNFIC